jgi:hypothetical protein
VNKHGKPVAFYSDKHAVFRVSQAETRHTGTTQFGRVLHDLNIGLICANSSQAKGRVERANLTLQYRLIKELRLESISSIENEKRRGYTSSVAHHPAREKHRAGCRVWTTTAAGPVGHTHERQDNAHQ